MVRARAGMKYTKTEQAIMEYLSDGMPHPRKEMHKMFCGPTTYQALTAHIVQIRKKLPAGHELVCRVLHRQYCYQHVRLIASANDGRT